MENPTAHDSLVNGWTLLNAGQIDQAARIAESLIEQNVFESRAWHLLSLAHAKRRRLIDALTCIDHAIRSDSENPGLRLQKGQYLIANGQRREALQVAMALSSITLQRADWNDALGTLFTLCDEPARAVPFLQSAVHQAPNDNRYQYNLAAAQRMVGDISAAELTLDRVIAQQPSNAYAYYTRADLRIQTSQNNHIDEMNAALEKFVRPIGDRILMHYAIAKELDDIGDYRRSFQYLKRGSDQQRSLYTYDVTDDVAVMDRIIERHTADAISNACGYQTDECIFVIGLPRTGTTLVEQVLSSHSAVFGAGELQAFPLSLLHEVQIIAGRSVGKMELVDWSLKVDPERLGRAYLDATRPQTGSTALFVDKQPTNYLYAGLIGRSLPRARIILVTRDPVDSCFAMYRALFTGAYPFSYTLNELAIYYAAWHRMMRHWQGVLGDRLLVVRYEDLVQRFDETAHHLVNHCGLAWEDRISSFHSRVRTVTTASATQVRRAIYSSSVGKWRNYETVLAPLIDALGSLAPSDGWALH